MISREHLNYKQAQKQNTYMSEKTHMPRQILTSALDLCEKLPPLKRRKNASIAAVLSFAFGGIGCGGYLESWVDFFIPWLILIILMVFGIIFAELPAFFAPIFWAYWAYRRVKSSNAKLEGNGGEIIEAEIVAEPPPLPKRRGVMTEGERASAVIPGSTEKLVVNNPTNRRSIC